jgi:2-hydroxy-3-oxopropionate reductase
MTVGVIGIGVMGSAIAARLLTRGADVHVHDRDPTKVAAVVPQGAIAHPTPASLAAAVDTVILSLNVATIVEQVVFGAEGVATAASGDKLLIDMSSIEPDATVDMARRLDEIGGMGWVDSPLSGGAPAALNGTLTLMLGGRDADFERARLVLRHLAGNMTHMGMSGTGQATKLLLRLG